MKHRCQEAGAVKEVAAWVDQKTGSQLLWGKGWFTLLYRGKCTVPIFEMCYTHMNKTPITQVRQHAVYTGVHIISVLPMRCQERTLLSHSQQTLPSTVQQMMTWALSLQPLHKSQWLPAVFEWGKYRLTLEEEIYASYDGFMMPDFQPCGHSRMRKYNENDRRGRPDSQS